MNAPTNIEAIWTREAVIQTPTVESGKPPVAIIRASTGQDVERQDWLSGETYIERLAISNSAVDLAYLNSSQAHLLDSHNLGSTEAILGSVTRAWIEGGSLYVEATGPLPGTSPRLDEVWNLVRQGMPKNVSIGYSVTEWTETREGGRLVRTATRWVPREVSLVTIGADSDAQVISTRAAKSTPMKEQKMNTDTVTAPRGQDLAERSRAAEIFKMATRHKLPEGMALEAVESGMTVEAFRAKTLDHLATEQEKTPISSATTFGSHNDSTLDNPNNALRAAASAMLRRGVGLELKGNQAAFGNPKPTEVARMFLEAKGERVGRFDSKATIIQRAYHTTSDYPILLGSVSQTVLAELFALYDGGISTIATTMTVPDFKTITEVRTGSFPSLEEVGEAGEITAGTIDERGESVRVKSFARMLDLSFQAQVNDSLGGFDQAIRDIAPALNELRSSLLIEAMAATMKDGKTVFHADHDNLAAMGDLPSVTTLTEARIAMRGQTAVGSTTPLGIAPRFLMVHPYNETKAQQLAAALNPAEVDAANPFAGTIVPVVEPQLPDSYAWYLAADPARYPALKFVTLEGFNTPAVETEMAFTSLGTRFRVHWHVGAFVTDYRPLFKNEGAEVTA